MLKAKKENRVVKISEEKRKYYENLGYEISDMSGKVLYKPTDPKKEIKSLKNKLDALEKENSDLKKKLAEAISCTEKADKRIEELEGKLKEAEKAAKTSETKKPRTAKKASNAGDKA